MYLLWTVTYFTMASAYKLKYGSSSWLWTAITLTTSSATTNAITTNAASAQSNFSALFETATIKFSSIPPKGSSSWLWTAITLTTSSATTNALTTNAASAQSNFSALFETATTKFSSIPPKGTLANKWVSSSGNRIFYLVRNAKLEFSACTSFCELAGKRSSLAVLGETIDPWFDGNGIVLSGEKYWVDKEGSPVGCHYMSARTYPRGVHCPKIFGEHDTCEYVTLYKRSILKSSSCTEKYGCICQRRI